jgi:hypothetical protein
VREWVGVRLVRLSLRAEAIVLECFQELWPASYPRTLHTKGFSIFRVFRPCGFPRIVWDPRNRTLKTIYDKILR